MSLVGQKKDLRLNEDWIAETLKSHNTLRAKHGAPPLAWSDDCAQKARLCADECARRGKMHHCHCKEYGHGQNIFAGAAGGFGAWDAAQAWYDEIDDPGYEFGREGSQPGTGHFTALVWFPTTHVGMNVDSSGKGYIVANYFPPGNVDGEYCRNVPPLGTCLMDALQPLLPKLQAKEEAVQLELRKRNSDNMIRP